MAESNFFDYTIEIKDKFTAALESFKAKLAEAKQAGAELKQAFAGSASPIQGVSNSLKAANKEATGATKSFKDLAEAADKEAEASKAATVAAKNIEKAIFRQKVAAEELVIIKERGLTLQAKEASSTTQAAKAFDAQAEAVKKLTKAQQSLETSRAVLGIKPGSNLPERIGPAELLPVAEVDRRVAAAQRLLAIQKELQSRVQGPPPPPTSELQGPSALLAGPAAEVEKRIAAAQKLLEIEKEFQDRIQGPPPPPTSELQGPPRELAGPAAEAEKIVAKRREQLEVQREIERLDPTPKLTREEIIQSKINALLERRAIIQGVNAGLAAQSLTPQGTPILTPKDIAQQNVSDTLQRLEVAKFTKELEAANPRIKELRNELGLTETTANRISFTFRRLIGIFAAFTVVRIAVSELKNAVAASVQFNREIQDATLGITSLFVATGKIQTATGEATTASEGFALANKEAARQVQLLRLENLRTAATFPELAKAFQSGVAPGLSNGLNLDQIRQLTVLLSKAASALSLPQAQLPEEIRSLLQGTITPRNTRIATSLGITNDDIKHAKEMGDLFEFLQKRLQAFALAGDEGLKTFSVRLSNARDAVQGLLAQGFQSFFQKLSDLLDFISKQLINITGDVFINPAAIKAVEVLGDVLSFAVDEAKRLLTTLSSQDAANSFQVLATILKGVIAAVEILGEGLLKASAYASLILAPIAKAAETISNFFGPSLRVVLTTVLGVLLAFKSIELVLVSLPLKAFSLVKSFIDLVGFSKQLKAEFYGINTLLQLMGVNTKTLLLSLGAITALLVTLGIEVNAVGDKYEKMSGVSLTFWQKIKLIAIQAKDIFLAYFKSIGDVISFVWETGLANAATFFSFVLTEAAKLADIIPDAIANWVPGLNVVLSAMKTGIKGAIEELSAFATSHKIKAGTLAELGTKVVDNFKDTNDKAIANAKEFAAQSTAEKARVPFSQAVRDMPAIVGNTTKEMENLVAATTKLRDEADAARESFILSTQVLGAEGAVLSQAKELAEARARIEKEGLLLRSQQTQAQTALNKAVGDQLNLHEKIAALSEEERNRVLTGIEAAKQDAAIRHKIAEQETKQQLAILDLGKKPGDESAKKRLADSKSTIADLNTQLEALKQAEDSIFSDLPAAKDNELQQIVKDTIDALGRQADAERRVGEAATEVGNLRRAVLDKLEPKLAEIGQQEFIESQKRIRELTNQIQLAKALTAVRGSLNPADEQFTSARNDITQKNFDLQQTQQQNQKDQDGLKKIIALTIKLGASKELIKGLQGQLNQLVDEGAKKEELAATEAEGAGKALSSLIYRQDLAQREVLLTVKQQTSEARTQIKANRDIIAAKKTISSFDDTVAQARAEISLQQNKIELFKEKARLDIESQKAVLASTVDTKLQTQEQAKLNALITNSVASYHGMVSALALMKASLSQVIALEARRALLASFDNKAQEAQFRVELQRKQAGFFGTQGINRNASELAALTATVSLEVQRTQELKRQQAIKVQDLKLDIAATGDLGVKAAKTVELVTLQQANSAELQDQNESLNEAVYLLEKFKKQLESPVKEGLFEGMRQFIREAPTDFDIALDAMKSGLKGLAQTGADAITAAFDPRNTTSVAERFGDLFLSVANKIIEGVLEQGIAKLLSKSLFDDTAATTTAEIVAAGGVAAGDAMIAAAIQAASILAGGSTLGLVADTAGTALLGFPGRTGGEVRGFAEGGIGRNGRKRTSPRDTIPAMLAPGEFVMRPEAVSALGVGFLDSLNNLRSPAGLEQIAGLGIGAPSRTRGAPAPSRSASRSASGGQEGRLTVLPVLVSDSQALERLASSGQGDAFLRKWMSDNGYKPTF